jgi:cell division protein FtsB
MYQEPPFSAGETNAETAETPHLNAETVAETFTLGEIEALARLVAAGKLGLTEAVKIGADAKSGERYQQRSRAIKARVEDLRDKYPQRTSDQETKRRELGLSKR